LVCASGAAAQSYPARPIRLVVAQSAGGNADFIARAYAQRLAERFGQQIVVDNRPGGAGIIGSEIVARAVPDGYTLLLAPTGFSINPALYAKLPFDPQRDFTAVSLLAISYAVVVVNPQSAVRTIADLIALAKAKPGQLHFASSGVAAATHLAGELFNAMAGVNIVHVAYKGAPPALVDLMAGRVAVMFASPPSALPLVRGGRLRAIATTGSKRAFYLPELPTVAESGVPGYENTIWQALLAPARTPAGVVTRLHGEIAGITQLAEMRERLAAEGSEALGSTPQEAARHLASEMRTYAKLIKAIGLKAE
ncbi:MAG TPA: tripartite tricarboxylate transporter substrate binding protein, partial [Bryobacteraceae bacterium]|nr:tripartite tricarboxylate transporter substrate binding protein [Bryobacteraceae bacterium]